ncbi:hypothetical protein MNBD_BACTEROID06-454 [hydrothermal vent metagenome]|uniref:Uncharacterized protein n=1 Tax=hydrothermal vent metagenome TaxID=652676 RepID=A0A3B0URJ7_9ZZZZ
MGTMVGNLFALIIIAASALVGFVSLEASATTFVAIAYLLWLLVLLSNLFTKPSKNSPFCNHLQPQEVEVYQRYYLHFWYPGGAQVYSALLNGLRFAGIIWGGFCLWDGLYLLGSLSIVYYFITGFLILKLNPWLYMGAEAKNANQVAIEQLSIIETVQEKRAAYNEQ